MFESYRTQSSLCKARKNSVAEAAETRRRREKPLNRILFFSVSLCLCGLCAMSLTWPARADAPNLPPHPRLLLDKKDIESLKTKIAGPFANQWKEFRNDLDGHLNDPIELPPRGGNWSHNYVCPEHGARLRTGKKIGQW